MRNWWITGNVSNHRKYFEIISHNTSAKCFRGEAFLRREKRVKVSL
jgi:hypothetical protein